MHDLDTREWLLTNGLGSFASGTVGDIRTRTYHGWLLASTNPPSGRHLLLSHLEATLEIAGKVIPLGTNLWGSGQIQPTGYQLLRSFELNPIPQWVWGEDKWQLTRQFVMPNGTREDLGQNLLFTSPIGYSHRLLIQYCYQGSEVAILRLRLLIGDRDFHHQQKGHPELQFSQLLAPQQVCLQAIHPGGHFGTPWCLSWSQGEYQTDGIWYWNYGLLEETRRGLGDCEDLYSPGYLTVTMKPGDTLTVEAKVGFPDS
jgi:predicted glycogen debranching enzyme